MLRSFSLLTLLLALPSLAAATEVEVLVVFHSQNGHTRAMAEAVAEGVRETQGARVKLRSVTDAKIPELLAADAVVLGSPVTNGNVAPEMQSFINSWPFKGQPMKDKVGAAFVSAAGISAGEETTQLALLRSMLCFGMVIVGGPHWTGSFGASAITDEEPFDEEGVAIVQEQFLTKARALGRRVAETTLRLHPPPPAKPEVPKSEAHPSPNP
jgi:NAD(P)H dehydrogenase (quinone)